MALKEGPATPKNLSSVGGDDRFVADYFDFECLSHLSPTDVHFMTRTAVLERMCGPLCDAVLESTGSASKLESLTRDNGFVVSLDRRRGWYRYHREFRDFLRAELEHREPTLVRQLNDRAAAWCESNDAPEAAISYARAAGDGARLARLVGRLALPTCSAGMGGHRRGLARLVRRGASDRAPSDGCRPGILGAPAARQAGGSNAMAWGSRGRRGS